METKSLEDRKLKKAFLLSSALLFLLSLTQKCYCTTSQCADSILVFLLGWAAAFSGAGFSWLANPLLFAAWLTLRRNLRASMFLSVFATLVSLSFLLFDNITDNEAGQQKQIIAYKPGYWLWVASSASMLIGTFTLMLKHNTRIAIEKAKTKPGYQIPVQTK
ncbi:MAG: hypothetical protein V4717_02885 [Bacteroidota bacterium]